MPVPARTRPLASRSIYLASYRPLTMNALGKAAIEDFGFPPYVDHSCRREPDFESQFPSISAICRGSKLHRASTDRTSSCT